METSYVKQLLSVIVNGKMTDVFRVMDLICYVFVRDGVEYQFHTQCASRISANDKILLAGFDVYTYESKEDYSLFDEKLSYIDFNEEYTVKSIDVSDIGDVSVSFEDNKISVQFFIDTSDKEKWRFIKVDSGEKHLVCYPGIFEFE